VLHRHPGISLPFTTNKAEIKKAWKTKTYIHTILTPCLMMN
jgi:hypothetical protein